MARIDIGGPYEKYLDGLVKAGYYRSVTAAAEAAIHKQMMDEEHMRLSSIKAALVKGEEAIEQGRTVHYSESLMDEISAKGKQRALEGKLVKHNVRP